MAIIGKSPTYLIVETEGSLGTQTTSNVYMCFDPTAVLDLKLREYLEANDIEVDFDDEDFDDILSNNGIRYCSGDSLELDDRNGGWIRYEIVALRDWETNSQIMITGKVLL